MIERRGKVEEYEFKTKRKKKLSNKEVEEDLIAEVQRLRMENAYLKKLQCLSSGKNQSQRTNEKVIVIDELRHEFKLEALLKYSRSNKKYILLSIKYIKTTR